MNMTKFFQKYFDGGALSKHWAYEEMHWIVRLLHEERYYRAVKMMLELSEFSFQNGDENLGFQLLKTVNVMIKTVIDQNGSIIPEFGI